MNSNTRTSSQTLRDWLTTNLTQLLTLGAVCVTTRHTLTDNSYYDVDTITHSNLGTVSILNRVSDTYGEAMTLDNLSIGGIDYIEVISIKEVDND